MPTIIKYALLLIALLGGTLALAQDATDEPGATPETTPAVTAEALPVTTAEATEPLMIDMTAEATPAVTAAATATPIPTATPSQTPTAEVTPAATEERLIDLEATAAVTAAPAVTTEATAAPTQPTDTALTYDTPVSDSISDEMPTQTWTFDTESADRFTVRVARTDGNLIPTLTLLDANGFVIRSGVTAPSADRAVIDNIVLTGPAALQVQVGRAGGDPGVTSGGYELVVEPLATGPTNARNLVTLSEVEVGATVSGTITPLHWFQRYTFSTAGADALRITATRTDGTLIPEVVVMNANGVAFFTGAAVATGERVVIEPLVLPAAGDYMVAVTRRGGYTGTTTGSYDLTLELVGAGPDNPSLDLIAGGVGYDDAVTGDIDGENWYADWILTTEAADRVTVDVERIDNTLQPVVVVFGPNGQRIAASGTDVSGARATLPDLLLPGPGEYTVRVARAGEQLGPTSGTYALRVTLIGVGETHPAFSVTSGDITAGETVSGTITPGRWRDTWILANTAEGDVTLTVTRTDGNLIPLVELRDTNGVVLATGVLDASRDRATLTTRLLADTTYQVVVGRVGGRDGVTAGSYDLTVE